MKDSDKTLLWKTVLKKRNKSDIIYLIQFGKKEGRDIDILLVSRDGLKTEVYRPFDGRIDLSEYPESEFMNKLELWDPLATEPILTGELIFGNQTRFNRLRKRFLIRKPTQKVINYLIQRFWSWSYAATDCCEIFKQMKDKKFLLYALLDLTFAASYFLYAKHYQNKDAGPITYRELKKQHPLLRKFARALSQAKDSQNNIDLVIAEKLIMIDWPKFIIGQK